MAVIGIVVMLTFVLSTGMTGQGNDFFDQLGQVFGGGNSGSVLAEAYGDEINERELAEIGRQRKAANEFLLSAIAASYSNWARELDQDLKGTRLQPETKAAISRFVALRANPNADPRAYQAFMNNTQNIQQITFARMMAKPESEDKKALDAVMAILSHDAMRMFGRVFPPVLPDLGSESDRELLDFALLLKKADQLGIRYSEDGVRELVVRETGGRLTKEDNAAIERAMRQSAQFEGMTGDWLLEAIGNEYRARAALDAMQGQSQAVLLDRDRPMRGVQTASALPGALTPYEFWQFYKDRCSEHTFSVLEVPAEAFLDQVTGEPTPKERVELFNKYRSDLPDPSRATPGFKEPRKVKVEYITLDATAPRVTKAIPQVEAASVILSGLAGPMSVGGNGVSALFQASHPALAQTLPIKQVVSEKMQANLYPYQDIERWEFMPRDTSIFRPQPIVSALGVLAGGPDIATITAAVGAVHQQVQLIDLRTRVPFLMQPVLAPFNPTLGNALGMPALAMALNPKLPPEGLYLASATKDARERQRQNLFRADLRGVEDKLRELTRDASPFMGKPDKAKAEKAMADARKYLDEWLKARGLTPTGTPEPIDRFSVASAAALKPLNEKAIPEADGTNSLAQKLFESFDPAAMGMGRGGGPIFLTRPFAPFWFPADPVGADLDKPNHFAWVTEEIQPVTYNSLDNANRLTNGEMTRRVDRAWKLEKARALAKAEADRLAEEVRAIGKTAATNPTGVEKQLRDLAEQKKVRKFEIENLAVLKFQPEATQARLGYEPPTIDKKQVLYPTPDFASQLLELRKQPLGAVTVLPDAPRSRYYVAATTGRTERTIDQFRNVFSRVSGPAQDPLYNDHALLEERRRAINEVMARLRAEAGLVETDAFKNREKREVE
jgi:hypothetical protein